jgi:hypothetical protein
MRRTPAQPVVLVLALALASSAPAADLAALQKGSFGSTKPGSWVKYEQTTTDPEGKTRTSEVTLSRLGGDGDATWLEMRVVPGKGTRFAPKTIGRKDKPVTVKYLLKADFKVEENALDYLKHVETMILQQDGGDAVEYPVEAMSLVAPALATHVDYGANATSLGACAHDGRSGEKVRIEGSFDVRVNDSQRPWADARMKGTTETELCLSDSVPFGRLHETTVTKDDKGKLKDTTEMRVLDSGSGATSAIRGPVQKWFEG